jgi:predicted RNA binding protein YcfA (HicA-like mRNA interferase family)
MADYRRQVIEILKQRNCRFDRKGKGDHEIWRAPNGKKFPVDSKILSRHTANAILKQAGINDIKIP